MIPWMLWIIVILPALGGIILPFISRHETPGTARKFTLLVGGLVALCALGALLALGAHTEPPALGIALTWLPGVGEIGLRASATGLYMVLALAAALVATLALDKGEKSPPPGQLALALGALAAANVAFLVSNFLGRYAALEIVALLVALAPLLALNGIRTAGLVYLLLRIGDVGFLVAVLLLRATGTLDIDAALAGGSALAVPVQMWIVGGFLLAVGVKVAIWPFSWWRSVGHQMQRTTDSWLYATVMPLLGLYLLYRIAPLLTADAALGYLMLGWGALGLLLALVAIGANLHESRRHIPVNEIVGSLALIVAGLGALSWVRVLALALAPLQWLAAWLSPAAAPDALETGVLERVIAALPQAAKGVGCALQRWHTGRLRQNLLWIALVLTLALAVFLTL